MKFNQEVGFYRFNDERQIRIYNYLKRIGSGPAAFFKDACRLMETHPPFESTSHLVGHLIREVESSVRAVLIVYVDLSQRTEDDGHRWEIRQIAEGLNIPADHPMVKLWLKNGPSLAHRRAHRDNLLAPRPIDQEFFDVMLSIFDFFLVKLEENYLPVYDELDKKLLIIEPAEEDAEWIKKNLPQNSATLRYFFQNLINPLWLVPLQSKKLFKRPPEPIYDPETNTVSFPVWALSRYLVKIAAFDFDGIKNKVGEIILGIETKNLMIHLDMIDAACLLPINLAVKVAEKEINWIETQESVWHLFPEKFSNLTDYIADNDRADIALKMTRAVLKIIEPKTDSEVKENIYFAPDPQISMSEWDYGQFISKCRSSLTQADWKGALILFCDLLNNYLGLKYPDRLEYANSNSYIWQRDLEQFEDRMPNLLVIAIRKICEETLKKNELNLNQMISIMETYRWDIFKRFVLHLLRLYPYRAKTKIKAQLVSRKNFQNTGLFHEYVQLLADNFNKLNTENQQKILVWIDKSMPSVKEWIEYRLKFDGQKLTEKEAEKSMNFGKLKWLEPLKNVLPKDWKEKYLAWTSEMGQPEHPGYINGVPQLSFGYDQKMSDSLSKLNSVEDIIQYLFELSPESTETPEQLGRKLTHLVGKNPHDFLSSAFKFRKLEPFYVRAFITGIKSEEYSFSKKEWKSLFRLLNWVMKQPVAVVDLSGRDYETTDLNWLQTRRTIGELISSVISKGKSNIPFTLRDELWSIIHSLTNDPNPTPEYEEKYGGDNMDPLTVAINTIRGEAFFTLVKFIDWCRTQSGDKDFQLSSEVRSVLDQHLDPEIDSSLAVRAVYGIEIPFLVSVDADWVTDSLPQIFPLEKENNNFLKSAWETFIIYTRPWDNVFDVLRTEYEKAIDRLDESSLYDSESSANHLAEHLTVFYGRGKIDYEAGGVLHKFYEKASDTLSAHIFWFIGRMAKETDIPQDALNRFRRLADIRIVEGKTNPEEMKAFGFIFESDKFDAEWRLNRLLDTLKVKSVSRPDHSVIETLAKLAPIFPRIVIECLGRLIDGEEQEWKLDYWSSNIRSAIESAMNSGESESTEILINKLAARGLFYFRDILNTQIVK